MGQEALKLELTEWLAKLDDAEVIEYLKMLKDSRYEGKDWWDDLSEAEKAGIRRGQKDIEEGRTVSHEEVKNRFGL